MSEKNRYTVVLIGVVVDESKPAGKNGLAKLVHDAQALEGADSKQVNQWHDVGYPQLIYLESKYADFQKGLAEGAAALMAGPPG